MNALFNACIVWLLTLTSLVAADLTYNSAPYECGPLLKASPTLSSASKFTNTTANACQPSCQRDNGYLASYLWEELPISQTITAETVVTVINRKKNVTRVTTITNTEADLSNFTQPANVNSDGSQTFTVTDVRPEGNGSTTIAVTFPYAYTRYPPVYTVSGQFPTTVNGKPTCTSVSNSNSVFSYPSHPTLHQTTTYINETRFRQDPKGWTYKQSFAGSSCEINSTFLSNGSFSYNVPPLFPDLGIWDCEVCCMVYAEAAEASPVALYLTDTSTSMEDDETTALGAGVEATQPAGSPTLAAASVKASTTPPTEPLTSTSPPPVTPASTKSEPKPVETSKNDQGGKDSKPAAEVPSTSSAPKEEPAKSTPPEENSVEASNGGKSGVDAIGASNHQPSDTSNPDQSSSSPDTLPNNRVHQAFTFGSETIIPNTKGEYIVGSQTVTPNGAAATVAGTPISIPSPKGSNAVAIIGTQTQNLIPASSTPPLLTLRPSEAVTPNAKGEYVVGSQTLIPGGAPATISGTPISLGATSSGSFPPIAVVGGSTQTLSPATTLPPALTLGNGETITPNSKGDYIVGSQTLKPGGPAVTVSGTPISLGATSTGSFPQIAVVGGSTQTLSPVTTSPPVLTLGSGETITPNSKGEYVVGSQTLTPGGPAITVSGTPISVDASKTQAVVGTSTEGLGPVIMQGFSSGGGGGNGNGNGTDNNTAVFRGDAPSSRRRSMADKIFALAAAFWGIAFGVFCTL